MSQFTQWQDTQKTSIIQTCEALLQTLSDEKGEDRRCVAYAPVCVNKEDGLGIYTPLCL